jgi:hypothetical protein
MVGVRAIFLPSSPPPPNQWLLVSSPPGWCVECGSLPFAGFSENQHLVELVRIRLRCPSTEEKSCAVEGTVQRDAFLCTVCCMSHYLKVEGLRFPADFTHLLSSERPFQIPCHCVGALGIGKKIALSDTNNHSAI